ncbi:MAG TPA: hypothetical protein VK054_07605 [Beutenbergiaceae bacterium]|nr:hypothetical protein [Beutenbergiaceae bacterium]
MNIGWVYTVAIRNNAAVHITGACTQMLTAVPYLVTGLDFDNGSEFMNHDLLEWSADNKVFFTRGRPYMKNDQATTCVQEQPPGAPVGGFTTATTPPPNCGYSTSCGR